MMPGLLLDLFGPAGQATGAAAAGAGSLSAGGDDLSFVTTAGDMPSYKSTAAVAATAARNEVSELVMLAVLALFGGAILLTARG